MCERSFRAIVLIMEAVSTSETSVNCLDYTEGTRKRQYSLPWEFEIPTNDRKPISGTYPSTSREGLSKTKQNMSRESVSSREENTLYKLDAGVQPTTRFNFMLTHSQSFNLTNLYHWDSTTLNPKKKYHFINRYSC